MVMTSRERVQQALDHRQPDRAPLDLGASDVTGMHVDSVYKLRQALQLDPPGTPVKIVEPMQRYSPGRHQLRNPALRGPGGGSYP